MRAGRCQASLCGAVKKVIESYSLLALKPEQASSSNPTPLNGNNMDEALRVKLDEARARLNSQQDGINASRKHDDPAMREWREENNVQQMQNGLSSGTR